MKTLSIAIFIFLFCIDFNVLNAQTLTQTQITAIEKPTEFFRIVREVL